MEKDKDTIILVTCGDSISMPRSFDGIRCGHIYSEIVKKSLQEKYKNKEVFMFNRALGGESIATLYRIFQTDMQYFGRDGRKILILSAGIVDCALRPIPLWLKRRIGIMPSVVREPIIRFLHNNRARLFGLGFKWRVTSPRRFKRIYCNMLDEASKAFSKVYVFTILPTTKKTEKHSPGLTSSIDLYNSIIRDIVSRFALPNIELIDINEMINEDKYEVEDVVNNSDGIHLTVNGHRIFADNKMEREDNENL